MVFVLHQPCLNIHYLLEEERERGRIWDLWWLQFATCEEGHWDGFNVKSMYLWFCCWSTHVLKSCSLVGLFVCLVKIPLFTFKLIKLFMITLTGMTWIPPKFRECEGTWSSFWDWWMVHWIWRCLYPRIGVCLFSSVTKIPNQRLCVLFLNDILCLTFFFLVWDFT